MAARNAHKAFIYACALLDLDARWLYPKDSKHLCECNISAEELNLALASCNELPDAVYVTSPDYLGNIADIAGLSAVCHSYGIPLLVDNAHGAYLAFLSRSMHPMSLGADMCADSAHKTLPVLTGGAYLHVSKNYDICEDTARSAMALFASTSPSYLILQSLDMCNAYLESGYTDRLNKCIERTRSLKERLLALGFSAESSEELKIVIKRRSYGISGIELAQHLRKYNVEAEFADNDLLVLMVTPELDELDFERVEAAFAALKPMSYDSLAEITQSTAVRPQALISIRSAMLAPCETVSVSQSVGRICAAPTVSCPPAVPIVMSGELIDRDCAKLLEHYGLQSIDVVK